MNNLSLSTKRRIINLSVALLILVALSTGIAYMSRKPDDLFQRNTLVLYAFSNTNPEYINNLNFFVKEAVEQDPDSDYRIIIQGSHKGVELPELPPHASYVFHKNECYDWGTFGWALGNILPHRTYTYYIFVNSSVRGPFLPTYARGKVRWTDPFINMLSRPNVKLVGPAINCQGTPLTYDVGSPWRANPHVQSYAMATDNVGLQVLFDTDLVFRCHTTRMGTIFYSELGASQAILNAGYNLGSFMTKYINVDWRDRSTWECNKRFSPATGHYDGHSLDPYEAMFVKYKTGMYDTFSIKASRYSDWILPSYVDDPRNITGNSYSEVGARVRGMMLSETFGSACFDEQHYLMHNPDLAMLNSKPGSLWQHFVYTGQFEKRPYRLTCPLSTAARKVFPKCATCFLSMSGLPPNTERPRPPTPTPDAP